jgi:hypothetical protein
MKHHEQGIKLFALASMIMVSLAPVALAQKSQQPSALRLYDSFDHFFIDPSKWSSPWLPQCGSPVLECGREIRDGQLRFRVRAYGATDTNNGTQFGSSGLNLTASSVTDIATQVLVRDSSPQDCSTNPGVAHSQVLVFGAFFNGGGGTAKDDVQAFLQLDRYSADPPRTVEVGGFLEYQGQFFGNVQLGSVNVGERVIVELSWDQPNHRFVIRLFRPTYGTKSEQSMEYTISDTTPAVSPFRSLSANVFPANCDGTRTSADLEVLFDNVLTN